MEVIKISMLVLQLRLVLWFGFHWWHSARETLLVDVYPWIYFLCLSFVGRWEEPERTDNLHEKLLPIEVLLDHRQRKLPNARSSWVQWTTFYGSSRFQASPQNTDCDHCTDLFEDLMKLVFKWILSIDALHYNRAARQDLRSVPEGWFPRNIPNFNTLRMDGGVDSVVLTERWQPTLPTR